MITKCPFCKKRLSTKTEKSKSRSIYKKIRCLDCVKDNAFKFSFNLLNNVGYELQIIDEEFTILHILNNQSNFNKLTYCLGSLFRECIPPNYIYLNKDVIEFYKNWISRIRKLSVYL